MYEGTSIIYLIGFIFLLSRRVSFHVTLSFHLTELYWNLPFSILRTIIITFDIFGFFSFRCSGCASSHRMPRYHRRPEVLLTWRKGRCGEWANAFSLILVSLGYETRYALWMDNPLKGGSKHNSPTYDECQTQSDKALALPVSMKTCS